MRERRRRWRPLLALALASLVTVTLALSTVQAYFPPRQVDPSTVQGQSPYPSDLLSFYANLVRSLAGGNFSFALSELNSTGLIHVPAQLQFVYSRFNSLLTSAAQQLEQVNSSIKSASSFLSSANFVSANESINSGYILLSEANVSVVSLEGAAPQMESSFGLPSGQLQSQVGSLSSQVLLYKAALDNLSSNLNSLESRISSGALHFTMVSLASSSQSLPLGSQLTLSGTLSMNNGSALAGKSLSIVSSLGSVETLVTGPGGVFSTNVSIPFVYTPFVTFLAKYTPAGEDASLYLPSQSNLVNLSLVFYRPAITVNGPGNLLPGGTYAYSGTYSNGSTSSALTVEAFGVGRTLNMSQGGRFSFNVTVPPAEPDGAYTISVTSSPHGLFAPAAGGVSVNVQRLPATVIMSVPSFVLGGETMAVYGSVVSSNGTHLPASVVSVSFAGKTVTTNTSGSGNFIVSLPVPLTVNSGSNYITAVAAPSQPWVSAASKSVGVFAIDPLAVAVPALLLIAGALLYRKRLVMTPGLEEKPEPLRPAGAVITAFKPGAKVRSELSRSYFDVVQLLSGKGLVMKPSMTPSEFSELVSSAVPSVSSEFRVLTRAFEDDTYGYGAGEGAAHEAVTIARHISEVLSS